MAEKRKGPMAQAHGTGIIARTSDPDELVARQCSRCGSYSRARPTIAGPTWTVPTRIRDSVPDMGAKHWECGACAMPWLRVTRIREED